MKTKVLSVSREEIQKTLTFKNLPLHIQNVLLNRRNVQLIENGVNVSTNIGFEKWDRQTATTHHNKMIIQELLKTAQS